MKVLSTWWYMYHLAVGDDRNTLDSKAIQMVKFATDYCWACHHCWRSSSQGAQPSFRPIAPAVWPFNPHSSNSLVFTQFSWVDPFSLKPPTGQRSPYLPYPLETSQFVADHQFWLVNILFSFAGSTVNLQFSMGGILNCCRWTANLLHHLLPLYHQASLL